MPQCYRLEECDGCGRELRIEVDADGRCEPGSHVCECGLQYHYDEAGEIVSFTEYRVPQ